MWNKRTTLPLLLAGAILSPAAPAWSQTPPAQQAPVTQSIHLVGEIVDARSGAPLKGVYVRQKDALNAVFTDAQGHFRLELEPGYAPMVLFQAEGYEPVALPFSASQERLRVNLQPLLQYTSDLPPAHADTTVVKSDRVFGNQFSALYQLDYTFFSQQNVQISGLVFNELGLSTDLLPFYPLAFRGRFFRSRMPVEIANFNFNPAFYINHQQAKIGAGWIHELSGPMALYLGGDLIYDNRSPDNRNNQDQQPIPFTGSLLDTEQNRLGLGLNAALGWKLNDRFTLFPEATLYPAMINLLSNGSPHYMIAGDLGAKLRFEIIPGVYAVGSYYTQLWYSFGPGAFENNHFFQLGLSLDPWAIAERLQ
ncbi:MAG: hypothetical protein ACAI44_20640 [Candidatus Sericytochromatia bacterium]